MSPAPISHSVAASASPPQQITKVSAQCKSHRKGHSRNRTLTFNIAPTDAHRFDEIFKREYSRIVEEFKRDQRPPSVTEKIRKELLDAAYRAADDQFFGARLLSDLELKMRAMTKVFCKVLAEAPWTDDWIRAPDVERKLSRFEMHRDSLELAAQHGLHTPREAIAAARKHQIMLNEQPKDRPGPRGPFDDIEIIYIPGTVSSTATNKIDRDTIYPVSVSSVAHVLHTHLCREMTKPYEMAEKFVSCTDTEELMMMRQFACDVVDFAPHLLDNDNVSLLIVLLILARSEITKRFENNGIRIEGSTISHRRAECLKTKLGWKTPDDRKPFDNVSVELQTRVKNACFPAPRTTRGVNRKSSGRKSSTPATPATPPMGYFPSTSLQHPVMNYHPSAMNGSMFQRIPSQAANGIGSAEDPMDLS